MVDNGVLTLVGICEFTQDQGGRTWRNACLGKQVAKIMSDLDTHSRTTRGRVDRRVSDATDTRAQPSQCLVVSRSEPMRELLSKSANVAGWDTVVCSDDENGLAAFNRTRFQMAFIDLTGPSAVPRGFRDLCRTLVSQPNVLVAVCGNATDPQEEIWARQLGVWLYLPGVALEHAEELSAICEQAQLVAGLSAELH